MIDLTYCLVNKYIKYRYYISMYISMYFIGFLLNLRRLSITVESCIPSSGCIALYGMDDCFWFDLNQRIITPCDPHVSRMR